MRGERGLYLGCSPMSCEVMRAAWKVGNVHVLYSTYCTCPGGATCLSFLQRERRRRSPRTVLVQYMYKPCTVRYKYVYSLRNLEDCDVHVLYTHPCQIEQEGTMRKQIVLVLVAFGTLLYVFHWNSQKMWTEMQRLQQRAPMREGPDYPNIQANDPDTWYPC